MAPECVTPRHHAPPGGSRSCATEHPQRQDPARNVPAPPSARGAVGRSPASGRSTRSARRHGDTESGFEVGSRPVSPAIRPLREVPVWPTLSPTSGPGAQCTRAAPGAWRPSGFGPVPCVAGRDALVASVHTDCLPPICADPCWAKPASVTSVVENT